MNLVKLQAKHYGDDTKMNFNLKITFELCIFEDIFIAETRFFHMRYKSVPFLRYR